MVNPAQPSDHIVAFEPSPVIYRLQPIERKEFKEIVFFPDPQWLKQLPAIVQKVHALAMHTFAFVLDCILFLSNNSMFVLGFCAGVSCTEGMHEILDRVSSVWQEIMEKEHVQLGLITVATVIAWPIAIAISAFLRGSLHGVQLAAPVVIEHNKQLLSQATMVEGEHLAASQGLQPSGQPASIPQMT